MTDLGLTLYKIQLMVTSNFYYEHKSHESNKLLFVSFVLLVFEKNEYLVVTLFQIYLFYLLSCPVKSFSTLDMYGNAAKGRLQAIVRMSALEASARLAYGAMSLRL